MKKHPTLFVTHRGERHQQAAIEAAPPEVEITVRRSPSKEEIISQLPGKEFLISERTGSIDAEVIAAGKDLRLIQRWGSQKYDIDLDAAREAGIPVCYWPVRTCVMVAEHMMMQLLAIAKRLREMMQITEEAGDWLEAAGRADLKTIFMVAPTTTPERLELILAASQGFIYYVSLKGVTGADLTPSPKLLAKIEHLRERSSLPVAVGFGVSGPAQAGPLAKVADGVIVGSALVSAARTAGSGNKSGAGLKAVAELARSLKQSLSVPAREAG